MAANTRLDSLHDLVRNRASLKVQCRTCDNVSILDAARFARYCMLRRWNTQLEALGGRLACHRCGSRWSHLSATPAKPGPDPFPTSEAAWRQLYRRLRD